MINKAPQKFNPQALKIAKELMDIEAPAEIMAHTAIVMMEIREEVRAELKKQSAKMRDITEKGEKRIKKLRDEARAKVEKIETQHGEIMERVREAQPELHLIEFRMNFEEGTYTPVGPRILDAEANPEPEKGVMPEVNNDISKMVTKLLDKFVTKKE